MTWSMGALRLASGLTVVFLTAAPGLGQQRIYTGHTGVQLPANTLNSALSGRCVGADFVMSVANRPNGTVALTRIDVNGRALSSNEVGRRISRFLDGAARAFLTGLECVRAGVMRLTVTGYRSGQSPDIAGRPFIQAFDVVVSPVIRRDDPR